VANHGTSLISYYWPLTNPRPSVLTADINTNRNIIESPLHHDANREDFFSQAGQHPFSTDDEVLSVLPTADRSKPFVNVTSCRLKSQMTSTTEQHYIDGESQPSLTEPSINSQPECPCDRLPQLEEHLKRL
jgi:hypothetical protein